MKKPSIALAAICAAILSGCQSYYEISTTIPNDIKVDDGEKPLAVVHVDNISYQLFAFLPFCTGRTTDKVDIGGEHVGGVGFFSNEATIDNNLKTVRAAAKKLGSNRISNINTVTDDAGLWSLYLFNRHTVRTSCLILEPKK